MKLQNLKKLKNKVLCELEDYLLDAIIDNMEGMQSGDEEALTRIARDVTKAVKDNALAIAMICYINDDGSAVVETDFEGQPLKLKVFTECFEPIMGIIMEFMNGGNESDGDGTGKHPRVVTKQG